MTDSNIGARKNKNIRDHLFVINGIINDVKHNKDSEDIDIQIYDITKCFDKLEHVNTATDFYTAGVKDDKFITVINSNKNCEVAIKTPWGKTQSLTLNNIEMQGTVLAGLKCSVSIDSIGRESLQNTHKILYKCKNCTSVPPLSLIDDILAVASCSSKSVELCATIKAKIEGKQLTLSKQKCHHIHVGKSAKNCSNLKIAQSYLPKSDHERYLGDILSSDGKNDKNIEDRCKKGIGYVNQILSILKEICFGPYYFEQALQLRNAKFINGILCSIESMYGLTIKQVEQLEKCDRFLLRKILNCPISTPTEALHLETATMPLRFVIIGRRLLYYWNILRKPDTELVKQVLLTQQLSPVKNDWCTTIAEDLRLLDIDFTQETISSMKKGTFKKLISSKIREASNKFLLELKQKHSKSEGLTLSTEVKKYLTCSELSTTEKQVLFSLRARTFNCKANYKNQFLSLACEFCNNPDTQEHLISCFQTKRKEETIDVEYTDIFGSIQQQIKIAKIMKKIFDFRQFSSQGNQEHQP